MRKAPEADRQEPACPQAAAAGVHHPALFWGSGPEKSVFWFCPSPDPTPPQWGLREGCVHRRGPAPLPDSSQRARPSPPPRVPVVQDLSPQGEGRLRVEAAMPALIKQRRILGLLAKRP